MFVHYIAKNIGYTSMGKPRSHLNTTLLLICLTFKKMIKNKSNLKSELVKTFKEVPRLGIKH